MTIDRRLLAGAFGIVLAVAACGGSSSGGSAAPAATAAGATTAPSIAQATQEPAATDVPSATDNASPGAAPSFVAGAASDLEAMLPSEAGGVKYTKTSFDGASLGLMGAGIDTTQLDPILKANGKTINDVRVALATPTDSTSTDAGMVIAFQIRGVDAAKFMSAMGTDAASLTKATVGGKDVLKAGAGGFSVVVYPKNDVLFEVLAASDPVTEAIVSQLP